MFNEMSEGITSVKKKLTYLENRCLEVDEHIKKLEKKLQETQLLENSRNKQEIASELKEYEKLLQKYRDDLHHLRTHDSIPLRLIMGLILVIFIIWMFVVLKNNSGKTSDDIEIDSFAF